MQHHAPNLAEAVVLIYEMEGMRGVQVYAKETGTPVASCLKLLADYFKARLEADLRDEHQRTISLPEKSARLIISQVAFPSVAQSRSNQARDKEDKRIIAPGQ
jgi:hypothetical protein